MFPNLHTAVLGHRNLQNNKWTNKASSQAKNKKEQTKPKTEKKYEQREQKPYTENDIDTAFKSNKVMIGENKNQIPRKNKQTNKQP